jgi:hypothetical protein
MTNAQSNRPDPFEAALGFSVEEADRLAASFKPSWEFDDAPFAQGGSMDAADLDRLAHGGIHNDLRSRPPHAPEGMARAAPPHAPPPRVATHEPEVSVIIDRSITANELAPHPALAPVQAAPVLAATLVTARPAAPAPSSASTTAKRLSRREASESLEIPSALRKSNKGLFVGIGIAVAAAAAVLAVRAATASSDSASTSTTGTTLTTPTSTAAATAATPAPIPPVPPTIATATAVPSTPSFASADRAAPAPRAAAPAATPQAAPAPHHAAVTPPPAAPAHHAAKPPAKPSGGGIVREVPF